MDAGSREEAAAFCVESVAPGWALYRDALLTTRRRGAESAEAQRSVAGGSALPAQRARTNFSLDQPLGMLYVAS